jgi:carbamoyltransferase
LKVLGINSVYHESAAALVRDGWVVAAAEEERFTRRKHAKQARVDNPHVLPFAAIAYCLDSVGLTGEDIDAFGFSFSPALREQEFRIDPGAQPDDWGGAEGEETFRKHLSSVPVVLASLLDHDVGDAFHWVDHHVAHAASSFYASGFRESTVLVVDGIGENASALIASAGPHGISKLWELPYPHSLGFLWEKISGLLGYSVYDACKVMGLAAHGDEGALAEPFRSLARTRADGFEIDLALAEFRRDSSERLAALFGLPQAGSRPTPRDRDVAAALQVFTRDAMLGLVEHAHRIAPGESLCLAGGVALNCPVNQAIKEAGRFRRVYVPAAPHDAGTAIGAALAVARGHGESAPATGHDPYLGPSFSDDEIGREIALLGYAARRIEEPWRLAAERIAAGEILGWFQGRMEFGPRALGNRSILADPRRPDSRERINRLIKRREDFRPFAPSVLSEAAEDWFELGAPSASQALMAFACRARAERAARIPAVLHADGTARVQRVRREDNPLFHRLIDHFATLTGVPLVLNTSFNVREPIVCTPADALRTFARTRLDALVLGGWLVEGGRA